MLEPIWDDTLSKSDYSLHYLRSGGATEAAENDVSDRMIDKHGRSSDNKSRNTYIKDSKRVRLSVTIKLGLYYICLYAIYERRSHIYSLQRETAAYPPYL